MTPTPGITALLRHARLVALEELEGRPANPRTLELAGETIRLTVLRQVRAGLWAEFGITEYGQMFNLSVAVVRGNALVGEPPLKIEWDFSRTALPLLVVHNDKPEKTS